MKSKIVENWLTKVNELTFTIPFAQLLLSKGQRVIHISSQGPMEQGKDIIAVDDSGTIHCYQLKSGKINSRVWADIKAEIDQLVELPPRHPSLNERVDNWEAYLVTNGSIANPTARDIYDYAESKKNAGHRPLKTIVGGELVADFTKYYDDFLPVDVVDLQEFIELYNQPGDYELDVGKFKLFFEAFFHGRQNVSRQRMTEAVRASLILCSYLLTNKYAGQNHLEIVKGYILLLTSMYEFAENQSLAESLWHDTENLIYEAVNLEFRQLIDELRSHPDNYLQLEYGALSEILVYKIRCTELFGYLTAYANYCSRAGIELYYPEDVDTAVASLVKHARVLGECTVPLFANHVIYLRLLSRDMEAAQELLAMLIPTVVSHTGENRGMPSPYYSIARSVEWVSGIGEEIREGFKWRSYSLWAVTLMAVRYQLRDELNLLWRFLSRISQQEVVPAKPKDYLLWRFKEGEHVDRFPDATQSWAQLTAEAEKNYLHDLPPVLRQRIHFLPLFLNVMPHRFSHRFALTLFDAITRARDGGAR